jgi:hypothetical protein
VRSPCVIILSREFRGALTTTRLSNLESGRGEHTRGLKHARSNSRSRSGSRTREQEDAGTTPAETVPLPPESEYTIPSLNRVYWQQFKRRYKDKKAIKNQHAIDVLIGPPIIPHQIWRAPFAQRHATHLRELDIIRRYNSLYMNELIGAKTQNDDQIGPEYQGDFNFSPDYYKVSSDTYTPMPDRLRINGKPLILLLEKTLELSLSREEASGPPVVLLKPFKLLIQRNDQIRELYSQMKAKFDSKLPDQKEAADGNTGGAVEGPLNKPSDGLLDEFGTKQAYEELRCLVEFMDKDLQVLSHFKKGTPSRIYFTDLWHIFAPGEEVITSQKPVNAYRVVHATGGRDYLSPPENEGSDENFNKSYRVPEKTGPFVVSCYYLDFDGTKYGPIAKLFEIQKYDGLKEVTSLPIYPTKFAKDPEEERKRLSSNGQKFLQLSCGEHRQYSGPNLHEQEEIDSQIIIDFEAALSDNSDKDKNWNYRPEFGLRPPPVADEAEVRMVSAGGCTKAECCENDHVYNDIYLDSRRMDNFITDKPLLTKDTRHLNKEQEQIPKEDLILFPSRLFAFVLRDRKWGTFIS